MEGPSEDAGDPEQESEDVASLAPRPSRVKAPSRIQSSVEFAELAAAEPSERGSSVTEAAAAETPEPAEPGEPGEPAEPGEEPPAPEAEGAEEAPGEREGPAEAEAEAEVKAEAEAEGEEAGPEQPPEEPAEPVPEGGGPEAPGEEAEEGEEAPEEEEEEAAAEGEAAAAARRKKTLSVASLPRSASSVGEAARGGVSEAELRLELEESQEEEEAEAEAEAKEEEEEERPREGPPPRKSVGFGEQALEVEEQAAAEEEAEGEAAAEDVQEEEEDLDLEWTEEVQRRQEQQLRAELLEQYRALTVERTHYQRYNIFLQHKIYEALRKKKGLDAAEVPEKGAEPEAPEKEEAYLRYLALLEELRKQEADDLDWYHQELDQLKQQCKEKVSRVEREWRRFQALKRQVVLQAMGSCRLRGGRQAALREVEQLQALEDKKEKEMSAVRLENVQLKQSLVHFETRMRAQEDTTDGLLLIDFEQLKIENQTFNEKVEERNEELLKLHGKVNHNVQIITHVKEKLHSVDIENAGRKAQLLGVEARVALRRDILTKTKQARDGLRIDNLRLNQKCGLLGKEPLLRDLEEKVGRTQQLQEHLEGLKRHHAGLTLSCRGVKQKIREARAFLPS